MSLRSSPRPTIVGGRSGSSPSRVSVVTVSFNDAAHLEETIRSVAVQRYSNIEHLVIDGGSTDGSLEVLRKYDGEIGFWKSERDGGVYDAMNKGIAAASGEWITFLNAGDTYFDDRVISDIFAGSPATDGADLIYGDVFTVDRDGTPLRRERARHFDRVGLKGGLPACHQTIFVRRGLCPRYDVRYRISSDLDWAISIFAERRIESFYFSQRPMVRYRVGGMSSVRTEGTWEAIEIIAKRFGWLDALLRTPIFIRWLIAAYLKRAFGLTTLKRFLVRGDRQAVQRQKVQV